MSKFKYFIESVERDDSKITPPYLQVKARDLAKLTCEGEETNWYYNTLNSVPILSGVQNLIIYKASVHNSGAYFCITKSNSHFFMARAQLQIAGKIFSYSMSTL